MELSKLKGVGPKTLKYLNALNIFNIDDLLSYYPYRYEIFEPFNLNEDYDGSRISINAIIESNPNVFFIRKNFNRLQFRANHNGLIINTVIFNRAFLKQHLEVGKRVTLVGKYDKEKNTFTCDDIKLNVLTKREIIPIYKHNKNIKSSDINKIISNALLENVSTSCYIPEEMISKYSFISKNQALRIIHAPHSMEEIKKAGLFLKYEELFLFLFKIGYMRKENENIFKDPKNIDKEKINSFISSLPFTLTDSQNEAVESILKDIKSNHKMNRLVLGDVGSGKTIVSFIAMYANFTAGYQSVLMAPTEVLAKQHYQSALNMYKECGINIGLLTGSMTKKEKDELKRKLKDGDIQILIGTHALIEENVEFKNLGLVITDEQHRFGVKQRELLKNKGDVVDALYMSATPIPRSYALTLYGDLDVSFIMQKPGGRKEIKTYNKKYSELKDVLTHILEEIKKGHQVYVVASLIDDNDELDLNSVFKLKEKFDIAYKNKIPIEILHGKLKPKEKEEIVERFKNNETKILISTTVIEVGVDVKNATIMVIFDANRFGLATLHQLRGRVGRNDLESYCYLICDKDTPRLNIMEESNDGFYIAEKDLELRGEGDLVGIKQSGEKTFKIANLKTDKKILIEAKKDVKEYIDSKEYLNNPTYKNIINNLDKLN